jgi:hypothetical protein
MAALPLQWLVILSFAYAVKATEGNAKNQAGAR